LNAERQQAANYVRTADQVNSRIPAGGTMDWNGPFYSWIDIEAILQMLFGP
jgi:hypothetical protein